MKNKIYAVDFDGTLCDSIWPDCGEPIQFMIDAVKQLQNEGNKIILWTCRTGKALDDAVEWCKSQGLIFDAVNDNLPEIIEEFGSNNRKVFANYYIDDCGIRAISSLGEVGFTVPPDYRLLNRIRKLG